MQKKGKIVGATEKSPITLVVDAPSMKEQQKEQEQELPKILKEEPQNLAEPQNTTQVIEEEKKVEAAGEKKKKKKNKKSS